MAAAAQTSSPKSDKSNEVEDSKDFINKGVSVGTNQFFVMSNNF